MEQVGLFDGLDSYFAGNPVSTFLSQALLLETVTKSQFFILNLERLLVGPIRVQAFDKARFTKEKIEMVDIVQLVSQSFICVYSEIR